MYIRAHHIVDRHVHFMAHELHNLFSRFFPSCTVFVTEGLVLGLPAGLHNTPKHGWPRLIRQARLFLFTPCEGDIPENRPFPYSMSPQTQSIRVTRLRRERLSLAELAHFLTERTSMLREDRLDGSGGTFLLCVHFADSPLHSILQLIKPDPSRLAMGMHSCPCDLPFRALPAGAF